MNSSSGYGIGEQRRRISRATWQHLPAVLIAPQWRWVTLGVVIMGVVMIRLGIWQLDRLGQRRAHNALLHARFAASPLVLSGQPIDVANNEYRRATVRGVYDPKEEIVLRNRSLNGTPGMDLVTPLRIEGSDQAVLVDRGWVPLLAATPAARQQFTASGPVSITGVLRLPQTRTSSLTPVDQQPVGGRLDSWFRVDVAKIKNQIPYPLAPYFLEQLPVPNGPDLPHPQPSIDLRDEGPHLSYAIQWFSFTVILLVGYTTFVARRSSEQPAASGPAAPTDDPARE